MRKRGTIAAFAIAAAMLIGPAATAAESAPPCEVMLPPDMCEQYYYGTLQAVGEVTLTVREAADDATGTVFDVAIWASGELSCRVWENCS